MSNYLKLDPEDRRAIDLFNRNVEWLKKREAKSLWVKSAVIRSLTGWDSDFMETARRNGYVKFKKKPGSNADRYLYDPSSINLIFLNKKEGT